MVSADLPFESSISFFGKNPLLVANLVITFREHHFDISDVHEVIRLLQYFKIGFGSFWCIKKTLVTVWFTRVYINSGAIEIRTYLLTN